MKAILVIDVPYITEPCEIDELGLVADMHIRPTTLSLYKSFDLKEVDVRPMGDYFLCRKKQEVVERFPNGKVIAKEVYEPIGETEW